MIEEDWLRQVLSRHWGEPYAIELIVALQSGESETVTHTATQWLVGTGKQAIFAKVILNDAFTRSREFYQLKSELLDRCKSWNVPVAPIVKTRWNEPYAEADGKLIELTTYISNASPYAGLPGQREALVESTFVLRESLDALSAEFAPKLAKIRLPQVVEEEHIPTVLAQAETQLLPLAQSRSDSWSQAAARALEPLVAAQPLLQRLLEEQLPPPQSVVHGDLHGYNFLLDRDHPSQIKAILDFDNLRVDYPYLDLSWLADQVAWQPGRSTLTRPEEAVVAAEAAIARRLLQKENIWFLMPILIAYAAPIIVDIAKDILVRNILTPVWFRYFEILDVERKLAVHASLEKAFPDCKPQFAFCRHK